MRQYFINVFVNILLPMVFLKLCVLLLGYSYFIYVNAKPFRGYESCPKGLKDKLNVHLICHSHNDLGWLKTVAQYYYGAKNGIQIAGVQYILNSVIEALKKDPKKKFIYAESAFFNMWWNDQHDRVRHQVKQLVCNGQLEFVGGGWSMNDEAATHYNSIIDQMTWGLRFLNDTFGSCGIPKVAWQIDPFGHSREQASLFAQMFYDGLFIGRIDTDDKFEREIRKTMECVWKGSGSLGDRGDLFTSVLPNLYIPPLGFNFDILQSEEPIMDKYEDNNVKNKVELFISLAKNQAESYATNHIVMTMGDDFSYQNADSWYTNLDKLITHVNERQKSGSRINVFYSTPSCYLYALNNINRTWPTKFDDFFPYSSDSETYWTGYFSSRPSLKRYERIGNNNLQMCKQLSALADIDDFNLKIFREAMGILQHHDAVTGTAKQEVTNDYIKTLATAIDVCQKFIVHDTLGKFLSINGSAFPQQYFCNYLNISECDITESKRPVAVTINNPLGWNVSTYIHLPVTANAYEVYDPIGNTVTAQIINIAEPIKKIPRRKSLANFELVFKVDLPPLGFSTYLIQNTQTKEQESVATCVKGDWTIGNEFFILNVSSKTGLLSNIHLANGKTVQVTQSFYWYYGMNGSEYAFDDTASGAYIFRPEESEPIPLGNNVTVTYVKSSLVQEIRQVFTPWLSQIIRVYKGIENIEFDWTVGPIPCQDNIGKEIITRFDTDLNTKSIFYTDANGREIQKRQRDYRATFELGYSDPVSRNYYPVNSRIFIRDLAKDLQFTVLTDRSQGGSSIKNGSIELMIHRRLLYDDDLGVKEALNEPGVDGRGLVIRGSHYLVLSNISSAASKHRPLAQMLYLQPTLSFSYYNGSAVDYNKKYKTKFSGLTKSLPPNIHLLTVEPWKKGTKLIRLEHIYEFREDTELSKSVKIKLKDRFSTFEIVSLSETTLGANQYLEKASRLKWNTNETHFFDVDAYYTNSKRPTHAISEDLELDLIAMQIRTFIASIKAKNY